jgi:hypothetical protein
VVSNERHEQLLDKAVQMADEFNTELEPPTPGERMELVKERIASAEVVFAVWEDDAADNRYAYLLVKGANLLQQIAATGVVQAARMTGIKCICEEQAIALLDAHGEPLKPPGGRFLEILSSLLFEPQREN